MIKETYVSFEQAKLLEEKGFPQDYDEDFPDRTMIGFSDDTDNIIDYNSALIQGYLDNNYLISHNIEWCVIPTLSLAQKWLMKEKNIHIVVLPNMDWDYRNEHYINPHYVVQFYEYGKASHITYSYDRGFNDIVPYKYDTPEDALSAGIDEVLKNKID